VLACGAHLKNTFCLAAGDEAWLGPHIGDLDNLEATRAFEEQVERLQRFLGIRPEVVAHDLHPDYASTRYALARPEATKVGVQHHHAHVASAMGEHGLAGPVLGLAWDGTGYGTDRTAWGGELLLVRDGGFERLATLRPLRLAGSDEAIRQVWRIALVALDDAFEGAPPLERLRLLEAVPRATWRSSGRWCRRACGRPGPRRRPLLRRDRALGLARARATYEGQVALEWNLAADEAETGSYPFDLAEEGGLVSADLRPVVRSAVEDLVAGVAPGRVSARFHEAMADVAAALVRRAAREDGRLTVVLTGGCFQNARLAEGVVKRLQGDFDVRLHGEVPPGDGGIALGQALVADEVTGQLAGGLSCSPVAWSTSPSGPMAGSVA
jgi:hydrogenase maturation protein HypF